MITSSVLATLSIVFNQQSGIQTGAFDGKITKRVQLNYLSYVPEDYSTSNKRYPLMLFLHGSGERGSDLEMVKKHGPIKEVTKGRPLPFVIIAPQCPDRRSWDVDELIGLLNEVEKKFRIDRSREYVTGLSMGGYGTWALLAAQPKRFAAAAPVCGGGDPQSVGLFAKVPLWVVHGDKDQAVNIQQSIDMVTALKTAGANPTFSVIAGGGHDVWSDFYASDEFYKWLLMFKR
jgi:predicted peptidase